MACTSPMYRIPFFSKSFQRLHASDQARLKNHGVILSAGALSAYQDTLVDDEVQVIPCGQCASCRLNYSRDWAVRCSLEAELHEHNYFITLTYDDIHVPRETCIDYEGVIHETTLRRRDIQLFIKRLREHERTVHSNTNIKVFYCGEYGENRSQRPHFHLCVFGVSPIEDLVFKYQKGDYKFYKSVTYENFWCGEDGNLIGFVDISSCSFDTIAYTARYIMKKQKGKSKKDFLEYYQTLGDDAPPLRADVFVGMSRRPGIAAAYYEKHKDQIYSEDLVRYYKKYDVFRSKPPRYFDKLFERDDEVSYRKLRNRRTVAGRLARKQRYKLCSEPELARLKRENDMLEGRLKKYVRCL